MKQAHAWYGMRRAAVRAGCGFLTLAAAVLLTTGCQRSGSIASISETAANTAEPAAAGSASDPDSSGDGSALASAADPAVSADTPAEATGSEQASGEVESDPARQPDAGEASPGEAANEEEDDMPEHPFPRNAPAPSLDGGVAWLNSAGPIDLKDLRGKFVLLDFWTYCCINCMHVLPELKKLEEAYPHEIVVIGVHSAKFDTEQESQNIADAILRYEIEHPVINDANHVVWNKYQVSSWPSLRVIDPEGNLVAGDSGEVPFEVLDQFFRQAIPYYRQHKLLDETPVRFDLERFKQADAPLRFPGKVLADEESGRLFIADSNHNRIVVAQLDGTLLDTIGAGAIGSDDGDFAAATFDHPQGMALDGNTLYVADTENHLLRKADLAKRTVTTIAGTGRQGRSPWLGIDLENGPPVTRDQLPDRYVAKPLEAGLNSPWALAVHDDQLYIAMAGPHQIWRMPLDESEIGPYAGNGREDIVDGPLLPPTPYEQGYASFAQPSGLAADDEWLYVADSEGSSIRAVPFDPQGEVHTIVGTANLPVARLFTFGDVDGQGDQVRLQHALGVAHHQGKLYVADTYNNKLKVIDLADKSAKTLAGTGQPGLADAPAQFDEPAGISYAVGKLFIADTNNHLVRVIDLAAGNKTSTLEIKGLTAPPPPEVEPQPLKADAPATVLAEQKLRAVDGHVKLALSAELPADYKINAEAPMSYRIEAQGDSGPIDRSKIGATVRVEQPADQLEIALPVTSDSGSELLTVTWAYYYCQESAGGLCKLKTAAWTVPLTISSEAEADTVRLETRAE